MKITELDYTCCILYSFAAGFPLLYMYIACTQYKLQKFIACKNYTYIQKHLILSHEALSYSYVPP